MQKSTRALPRVPSCSSLAAGLFALACSGGAEKAAPPPSQPAAAPAQASGSAGATTARGNGEFGLPECDQYIKKYLACIDSHVPESARSMVRLSFDRSRAEWKRAAATPEGRAGLASACLQAEAASKAAMQAHGCQW